MTVYGEDFEFIAPFRQQREQILRVEALSDAYHLTFARRDGREAAHP
jgi:hypothetical protein